ncbi:type II toxin-antitoxin system PemK/MazF family toxin [Streptomyces sp. LP05-1]|uniref:Type II toxin-antitoxin system PemK/MazF family toxin n=1 Tax=Streptomyces pyxinae TaxID=2970734 RepID=A0ABT2CBB9_9ACTN|nr:type II toxin-antitoxin system PemK/MazF family toxin [Streptomyces sp. LP05-1]MCS0634698.1 type II toxin-antitoxin system PemK/MazF family toxin [Streptomyces sp. LP05-1]
MTEFSAFSESSEPRGPAGSAAPAGITSANGDLDGFADRPGRFGPAATTEAEPREVGPVRTSYAPDRDGAPDPGEIVWTWVPYEEKDGRGKDRPVLVVAREEAGTLLAVQLSSRPHDGDREWVAVGSGPWDDAGRESWADLDRVLRVHEEGMRREACALDRPRFDRVVTRLAERYGWR